MFILSRGTVSARFTILYASVFLGSGATLLALAFLLSGMPVTDGTPAGGPAPPTSAQPDRQLMTSSAAALLMMAVVSLVMGRILAGRVLRPLRSITTATQRITAESLDRRLAVAGPADEVKALADTIDGLLERLENSFDAQRRFVANASHELRTPLSTMRAALDVAVAKPDPAPSTVALADRLRTQLDRVDHLLDGFLVLARAQHGALADADTVELGDLIAEALRQRAADVQAKQLTVTAQVPSGATTRGSPALLARLVENVVDNAVRHNADGGLLAITVVPGAECIVLTVDSSGHRLDQRDVDRLTRPFERLDPSPTNAGTGTGTGRTLSSSGPKSISAEALSGAPEPTREGSGPAGGRAGRMHAKAAGLEQAAGSAGLGLSIVAAVTAAHGGRLDLTARTDGGLRVVVILDAAS
ncbi:HAMP domain-containing sensor histidine kinase [Actinoplanes sp. DH11]|uniref:sensor histidine kinase n=1 Tax=Actinoplanes sp. DH11 TaxID=2857011 RepID=UPI0027148948|nr:HAMP domain-containing sensor histidine kinase [Actinoplanes sp. DH11]